MCDDDHPSALSTQCHVQASGSYGFDSAKLFRPNFDTLLQRIDLNNSELVVVFLCSDYQVREWCGLEWRAIRAIIKNKNDHAIMVMQFDNVDVSGSCVVSVIFRCPQKGTKKYEF